MNRFTTSAVAVATAFALAATPLTADAAPASSNSSASNDGSSYNQRAAVIAGTAIPAAVLTIAIIVLANPSGIDKIAKLLGLPGVQLPF
ncbi:hypothetical protein G7Y29_07165 [Corynebacterium qintianiae]|uniref:Secreted protein n=1 Tax=Corynebacterium qintianiae TaxID=2709392 RepID=A0A7T0PF63_9CORY|nr:hypothetical protein [Corynebacterium qintianiae]QPK82662.1 hypothetical protein G7Y29_07165 [Corynebacterium qintianiae]